MASTSERAAPRRDDNIDRSIDDRQRASNCRALHAWSQSARQHRPRDSARLCASRVRRRRPFCAGGRHCLRPAVCCRRDSCGKRRPWTQVRRDRGRFRKAWRGDAMRSRRRGRHSTDWTCASSARRFNDRPTYSSKRPVASRSRSYRLVSGNGGNQDSRRTVQSS